MKKKAFKYQLGAYLDKESHSPEIKAWLRGDDEHEAREKFRTHLSRKGYGYPFYFLCVMNVVLN